MRLDILPFMQDWPPRRRRRFLQGVTLAVGGAWAVCFLVLTTMTDAAAERTKAVQQRYDRVAPLVEEAVTLQARKGTLASMKPLAAAQQVSRDLKLDSRLASLRPAQLAGGQEGVQLFFESLDLAQLYDLLEAIQDRSGLKVFSMNFTRRMDVPDRADIQLVLVR